MTLTDDQIRALPIEQITHSSLHSRRTRIFFAINDYQYSLSLLQFADHKPYTSQMIHHENYNAEGWKCPFCKPTKLFDTCIALNTYKHIVVQRLVESKELRLLEATGMLQIENK